MRVVSQSFILKQKKKIEEENKIYVYPTFVTIRILYIRTTKSISRHKQRHRRLLRIILIFKLTFSIE